ncbi:hypothetical protein DAEQUDRAFT_765573 [Daedalea quercina L-15889]|uniref:Uncharacterized protein n=1 Tax=Daedalea quercina L-15889 TaxID=1314783 RepID=A0A165QBW8_9APHY|nr:hypothetical protein DAEQUDRAFT_765573 [Daedalea quercina L-15889]
MSGMVSTNVPDQGRNLSTHGSSSSVYLTRSPQSSSSEDLLSYSLILPSCTVDSLSLHNVPPFPSGAMPPLYLNAFDASSWCLPTDSTSTNGALITIPTRPRLRFTMMETICIDWWRSNVFDSPPFEVDIPPDEPELPTEPVRIPEGCAMYREHFMLTTGHALSDYGSWSDRLEGNTDQEEPGTLVDASRLTIQVQVDSVQDEKPQHSGAEDEHEVPTIMVSSSTAIVPLSLESTQSLASVPLALRRGKKMPPPITVHPPGHLITPLSSPLSSYPDIPSPFLGSPSPSRLSFDYLDSEPSRLPIREDLVPMCVDLYARLPTMSFLPLSPASEEPEGNRPRAVACEQAPEPDVADDWAGAQEFVEQHADDIPRLFESTPVKSSPPLSPGSNSWDMSVTLVDPTEGRSPVSPTSEPTDVDTKRQRRKTVIIETSPTPRRNSLPPTETQESDDEPLRDQDPIPFEAPAGNLLSCTACHSSMLVQSRPVSSASMRPAKGILKEKKSVRFSMVPECIVHDVHQDTTRPRSGSIPPLPKARSPPTRHSFTAPVHSPPPTYPTKENEPPSWPRHPALRAIARHTTDLSSPLTPTPTILTDERRSPLRSLNARQSLQAKRSSTAVPAQKRPRLGGVTVDDIGQPRRLKATSTPGSMRTTARANVENAARKGEMLRHRSRMPIPNFRSLLGMGKSKA